jgi:rhodanese-related sulfurtransferase
MCCVKLLYQFFRSRIEVRQIGRRNTSVAEGRLFDFAVNSVHLTLIQLERPLIERLPDETAASRLSAMSNKPSRFKDIVDDAKRRVHEVTVAEVSDRLKRGEKLHLVDVREESEWIEGHAANAVHLSKGVIERDIEKRFPDTDAELVLYCGGGSRSALAADNLQKMGYTKVRSMIGGFRSWREAGCPVEGR